MNEVALAVKSKLVAVSFGLGGQRQVDKLGICLLLFEALNDGKVRGMDMIRKYAQCHAFLPLTEH